MEIRQMHLSILASFDFITFLFLFCSNLRRLVHAMILKRPPGEWVGTYRFDITLFLGLVLFTNFSAKHYTMPHFQLSNWFYQIKLKMSII